MMVSLGATLARLWLGLTSAEDLAPVLDGLTGAPLPCAADLPALESAVTANPGNLDARRARGVCLYQLGRLEWAWDDLSLALAQPTAEPEALAVGAIVAARQGHAADSRRILGVLQGAAAPDHAQRIRAEIVVKAILGDRAGAWRDIVAALDKHGELPELRVAATELVALDPDGAPARVRQALGRRVNTVTRANRASGWLNAGQPAACLAEAQGALAEADPTDENIASLQILIWRCAVAAGQVGPASQALKAIGRGAVSELQPGTMIAHVRLVRDAGEPAMALRLLALVPVASDADRQDVANLSVGLRILTGDLDGAIAALAAQPSAITRTQLARALSEAGRKGDAANVLDGACEAMTGNDAATCTAWRGRLRAEASP